MDRTGFGHQDFFAIRRASLFAGVRRRDGLGSLDAFQPAQGAVQDAAVEEDNRGPSLDLGRKRGVLLDGQVREETYYIRLSQLARMPRAVEHRAIAGVG